MSDNELQAMGEAKLEALVEVMFLAASADGEFSTVERALFLKTAETLTNGRLTTARLASRAPGPRSSTDLAIPGPLESEDHERHRIAGDG